MQGAVQSGAMTATLSLVPLTPEDARTRLEQKGVPPSALNKWVENPDALPFLSEPRRAITLKLCTESEDVVDVEDGDSSDEGFVQHAKSYKDGSIAAIVTLGRNNSTLIKWTFLSRGLCDVSLTRARQKGKKSPVVDLLASPGAQTVGQKSEDDEKKGEATGESNGDQKKCDKQPAAAAFLGMRKPKGKHCVYLNAVQVNKPLGRDGETPLNDGAIISLYGPTGFAYQVCISQSEKAGAAAAPKSPKAKRQKANPKEDDDEPTPLEKVRTRGHELVVGECTCAMCMDILVQSTFALPCLHPFCKECAAQLGDSCCPTCREEVEDWRPARNFDSMIWGLALQGCFQPEDAKAFLERREEGGEDAPTDLERDSILRNTKIGGKGAGGGTNIYLRCDSVVAGVISSTRCK